MWGFYENINLLSHLVEKLGKTGAERRDDLETLAKRLRTRAESLTNEANEAWNAVKKYASNTGEHFKHHCSPECGDDCHFDNFEPDTK